jgi:predicted acylesterase/phospholipase RssA
MITKQKIGDQVTSMGKQEPEQQMVIFQGGGALGAYECGVYQTLVEKGRVNNLAVIAGTSIGAINASIVAHNYHKANYGADQLVEFWKETLSAPVLPLFPDYGIWHRWNAIWTAVMFGNPHLYTPALPFPLSFLPPASWMETHWYDTAAMEQTLSNQFKSYGGPDHLIKPRLMITAVDLKAGALKVFDSWKEVITPRHVVACGSLPPSFPATKIGDTPYWDGGLWSNSPLRDVLRAIRNSDEPIEGSYKVYLVNVFPKSEREEPHNAWEVSQRMAEISFGDKTSQEQSASTWVNRYIDLVETFKAYSNQLPQEMKPEIQKELDAAEKFLEKRVLLDITSINRTDTPDEEGEHVSRDGDFSRERIEELMQRGREDAARNESV